MTDLELHLKLAAEHLSEAAALLRPTCGPAIAQVGCAMRAIGRAEGYLGFDGELPNDWKSLTGLTGLTGLTDLIGERK